MHALSDLLERAGRLLAGLAVAEAREGEFEERGQRGEALDRARTEDPLRLDEREDRDELPVDLDAAQREGTAVIGPGELQQARVRRRFLGDVGEGAAILDRAQGRERQLLEGGLERQAVDASLAHRHPFAEQSVARIEAQQRDRDVAVALREGAGERDKRGIEVGRGAERLRERGNRSDGHWERKLARRTPSVNETRTVSVA